MQSRRLVMRSLCAAAATAALLGSVAPAMAAQWEPGFYGPRGVWHPGHWVGGPGGPPPEALEGPPGYIPGRVWIRGHYGPEGVWHPGHWR